jgi:hypothetical protein
MERRKFIINSLLCAGGISCGFKLQVNKDADVLKGVQEFLSRVANPDGSYRPGIDPAYPGKSDTGLSGIAAPTYAIVLSRTFGWELPYPNETREFLISCQKPDGAFYAPTGSMDMDAPLAKLYNTVQAVVALRHLGEKPRYDPIEVIDYFFEGREFTELPLYTTSFFPLFFCASGKKMSPHIDKKMRDYILGEQQADGYLQDHVAATFHAAHYFRLAGEPTPKAEAMVDRVLRDQQADGSWHLHEPAWDVHACFDALFILRQLADTKDNRVKKAFTKATDWILSCRKPNGGFSHFPFEEHADVDAVYFQVGGLVESGYLKVRPGIVDEEILGWGHAMDPKKTYSCI